MNESEYEKSRNDLFEKWKKARPEYEDEAEGKRFTHDGIMNYEAWKKSKPKILFLLKENRAAKNVWEPWDGITVANNIFGLNIARWRQILIELSKNPAKELSFSNIELPETIDDIAIIEVKKLNEGKGSSTYYNIKNYAINDKDFLKEEFELINPDIVMCGNTGDYYGDIIYGEDSSEALINDSECYCYKHGNRLVIEFYHPSTRSEEREEDLFEILCRMIKNGNVFEKFNWGEE